MRRAAAVVLGFGMVALVGWSQPKDDPTHVVPYDARTPAEQKKAFKLPPGFDIELVAAEPDIHKPMNIAFDARGRLWVTDTIEYPFPVKEGEKSRDTVKILEDFGPDGKADGHSPDRVDALVWALTELVLNEQRPRVRGL